MKQIYRIRFTEDGAVYYYGDMGKNYDYTDRLQRKQIKGESIKSLWNPEILTANAMQSEGVFSDFSLLGGIMELPLLSQNALALPFVRHNIIPYGELLPINIFGRKMFAYNCMRIISCVHPELKYRSCYPVFYPNLAPERGFFRVPDIPWIYGVDSELDEFQQQFYASGQMGWRFEPVEILDEEPAPALKKKAAAAKRNHK